MIANVDVPDFSRRELTMSRIVFAHRDAGRPAPASDGLPLTPTLDRVFNGGDPVTAWVRIHQGTKRRPADAAATIRMLDSDGQVIAEERRQLAAEQFEPGREQDLLYEIPTSRLAAGTYGLSVRVTTSRGDDEQLASFVVREMSDRQ